MNPTPSYSKQLVSPISNEKNTQDSKTTLLILTPTKWMPINHRGYILLLTMVLLIILTILAITLVSLNTTQTRIAAHATDTEIILEKTEGALNEASNNLLNGTYNQTNFLQNTSGLYLLNPSNPPLWTTVNWSSSSGVVNSFQGSTGTQARYIIEQLPSVIQPGQNMKTPTYIYRVTARSVGASSNSVVLLQGTVQIQ